MQSNVVLRPKRSVGQPPNKRAEHRAVKRRRHRDAVHTRAQSPELLNRLLRAGNDHRVEAEQESSQCRSDGPQQDAPVEAGALRRGGCRRRDRGAGVR